MDAVSLGAPDPLSLGALDFVSLGELAQKRFGWKLYTAMRYLTASAELERLHSSDLSTYPLSGRKLKRGTAWSKQVLERGEPFIGDGAEAIRAAFDDAERILACGLVAVINVPVKAGSQVVGTLNFLREPGGYRREQLAEAQALAVGAADLFR